MECYWKLFLSRGNIQPDHAVERSKPQANSVAGDTAKCDFGDSETKNDREGLSRGFFGSDKFDDSNDPYTTEINRDTMESDNEQWLGEATVFSSKSTTLYAKTSPDTTHLGPRIILNLLQKSQQSCHYQIPKSTYCHREIVHPTLIKVTVLSPDQSRRIVGRNEHEVAPGHPR